MTGDPEVIDVAGEFGLCHPADGCVMDRACMNFDNCEVTEQEMAHADDD
jgi:hypothetical protein